MYWWIRGSTPASSVQHSPVKENKEVNIMGPNPNNSYKKKEKEAEKLHWFLHRGKPHGSIDRLTDRFDVSIDLID